MTEANGKVYFVTFQRAVLGLQKVPDKTRPVSGVTGRMTPGQQSSFGKYHFSGVPEPVITLRYDWVPFSLISDLHPFACLDALVKSLPSFHGYGPRTPPPVLVSFQQLTASDLVDLPDSILRVERAENMSQVVGSWTGI